MKSGVVLVWSLAIRLLLMLVSTVFALVAVEGFFLVFPRQIPEGIKMQMPLQVIVAITGNDPRKLVERLPESPWLKFKPNVEVVDYLHPGEVDTFTEKWTTDDLGFKNEPVRRKRNVDIVLLGDSHVEGYGVHPSLTTARVLRNKYGLVAYSLGVEGYGPQQFAGVFQKYGLPMKPKLVVYVKNGSSFLRAYALSKGQLTGAIKDQGERDEKLPSPVGSYAWWDRSFFLNGFRLLKSRIARTHQIVPSLSLPAWSEHEGSAASLADIKKYLVIYLDAYFHQGYYQDSAVTEKERTAQVAAWDLAMQIEREVILDIKSLAENHGAQFAVMVVPTVRYEIEIPYPDYTNRIKNTMIQGEYDANSEIMEFCRRKGIGLIDCVGPIQVYMKRKFAGAGTEMVDYRDLPFFKKDGHPSPVGHAIYAAQVMAHYSQLMGRR